MANEYDAVLDMFCTALQMKEKKKALYEEAMKTCPDQVGIETFRMLRDAEDEHHQRMQKVYEEMKQGPVGLDACQFHTFDTEDKRALLRRVAEEYGKVPKACVDDVVAIETGMQLEDASILFFDKLLSRATNPAERDFIQRMLVDEREHYRLLADLKFYYVDTEQWFLEKGRQRLDGAGAFT